ncbi:MAG: alkaline phosphatase family protein [Isosphaeraceae bacterium]
MKILVIGLDGAVPERLLGDERLGNLRQLMEIGCYGPVECVIPPTPVPAWMCLATGRDPGLLGVYGARGRADRGDRGAGAMPSRPREAAAIWDLIEASGKHAVLLGTSREPGGVISPLHGPGSSDPDPRGEADEAGLGHRIEASSREQFNRARRLLSDRPWDYFQIVDSGLARLERAARGQNDPGHVRREAEDVIADHYGYLDGEIGGLLELLTEDTIVLIIAPCGAQGPDAAFGVNEWLVREGLLVLNQDRRAGTTLTEADVDWDRTKVWSEGADCARLFFNVRGREPSGVIAPEDYEAFRDELKARLKAAVDEEGRALHALVFRPEDIYGEVRGIAPDLIAPFRRADGMANGAFILAGPALPVQGALEGVHLLDIAPTLLELGGYDIPEAMRGRPLTAGRLSEVESPATGQLDEEELIRDRLRGLGYIA